jgi:hypothetical protein
MFQGWRLKLKEAEEAFAHGRLHEAERLLREEGLTDFLPGRRLADRLALRLAQRGRELLLLGDSQAAWRELAAAEAMGGDADAILAIRREMTDTALRDVEGSLAAGDLSTAAAQLDALERCGVQQDSVRQLREISRRLEATRRLAARGKLTEAAEQLAAVPTLRAQAAYWTSQREDYKQRAEQVRSLTDRLHRALALEDWSDVAHVSDELLALAPEMPLAREARQRAWAHVGARLGDSRRLAETHVWSPSSAEDSAAPKPGPSKRNVRSDDRRFLLWVDAVGGYLVCLDEEVVVGQAALGNDPDIPILGDLSRRHAVVRRSGDGYLLEPVAAVMINGRPVNRTTVLRDGDEIQLGQTVRLAFRQPHALSATARLDFLSRHRTQPWADSVLLMAESCVLGPRKSNHVLCRDWTQDVILYRKDEKLYCRAMESLEIDGQVCDGRGELTRKSRVSGTDFSLSLEPV